ncbi:MAG: methionine--tRNA ligase [Vicinamibacterales bacterium]|jgi:methionyl-tRNA synthetase|nr:methionine--tRNA ligase [Acidobacteriota bacterium]MDP7295045.1 methionine--tRNA ligase [Vicinamibacterales bacterium]MDP7671564.1 methionine--tRNA ligase [Vicinamibacterales bacterium]HJO38387.1 methionine--tRNA ligase [Vicinamibacterales bacterium]
MSRFYLTTAIDYVNSRPHLGTAYEKVTADVIARYQRLRGVETNFLMGNDEHSQNVHRRARELGLDPIAYCDQMEAEFRTVWRTLDVSFDGFIRTTEPRHRAGVTRMLDRIAARGDLYEGFYEGWYCVSCEAFKQEKDLVDGKCPLHHVEPKWLREKNHFFRLSNYRDALLSHFEAHPEFLQPEVRRNEILRLLEGGLEDISVSRSGQAWGIPMPESPESVVYVWFDALINYASGVGYGTDESRFDAWWPADLHIVGKDITRFHSVFWPAMLMSAGVALPRQVFGHGWVHHRGERMSKTLGTTVDPLEAADRFGVDPLRLYLVKEIPYGQDGDFAYDRFEERYNVDLANNLGNLVSRVATMADKYRGGRLPATTGEPGRLPGVVEAVVARYTAAMDRLALHAAAAAAFSLVDAANEYITETEPWALAREPAQAKRLSQVLHETAEAVRIAAVLLSPVMPASAEAVRARMGGPSATARRFDEATRWSTASERTVVLGPALWPRAEGGRLPGTHDTGKARTMTDTEKDHADESRPASEAAPPAATPTPPQAEDPRITFDAFMEIDLRVATVLAAEKVEKSRKLIKVEVDLGTERRTVVAGIAEAYAPEDLVGRTVVVVANLKPAKLMGIESNGMILAASLEGGIPALVRFDDPPPPPGTRVR